LQLYIQDQREKIKKGELDHFTAHPKELAEKWRTEEVETKRLYYQKHKLLEEEYETKLKAFTQSHS